MQKPFKVQFCHNGCHLLGIVVKGQQVAERDVCSFFWCDKDVAEMEIFSYFLVKKNTNLVSGVNRQSLGFEPGAPGGQTDERPVPAWARWR